MTDLEFFSLFLDPQHTKPQKHHAGAHATHFELFLCCFLAKDVENRQKETRLRVGGVPPPPAPPCPPRLVPSNDGGHGPVPVRHALPHPRTHARSSS
jgi:hypothetical protein